MIDRRFPKLTCLIDRDTHLILALLAGRGPRPDVDDLRSSPRCWRGCRAG